LKVPYKGFVDCCRRIAVEEGLKGFWKGNLPNLLRIIPN
jgi:hypothetical protein